MDTMNKFLVSIANDKIAILNTGKILVGLTPAEALNLAAWLVALASPGNEGKFEALLKEVTS